MENVAIEFLIPLFWVSGGVARLALEALVILIGLLR